MVFICKYCKKTYEVDFIGHDTKKSKKHYCKKTNTIFVGKKCSFCRNKQVRKYQPRATINYTFQRKTNIRPFLYHKYKNIENRVMRENNSSAYGKFMPTWNEFFKAFHKNKKLKKLMNEWAKSGFERKLVPSVDRIDDNFGYEIDNIQWITWSENSRKGALKRHYKNLIPYL